MPAKFLRLVQFDEPSGNSVYLNPIQVAYVRRLILSDLNGPVAEWAEVGTTGGTVTVTETAAQVVKKLQRKKSEPE